MEDRGLGVDQHLNSLSNRLGHFLQSTGLRVVGCSRALGPTGTLCSRYTGIRGTPLRDIRATATAVVSEAIEGLSRALLARGPTRLRRVL